jgi:hypothetical protein
MCEFFSCVVTRDGRLLFTEEDSHETIISRAGLRDTATCRHFVRLEISPPFTTCRLDQSSSPSWFDENRLDYEERAIELAKRIAPAYEAYQKATATAYEAYQKATATAEEAYQKATAPAYEAYQKAKAPAYEAYQKATATAEEAYIEVLLGIEGYVARS